MKKIHYYMTAVIISMLSLAACTKQTGINAPAGSNLRWFNFKQLYLNTTQSFNSNVNNPFSINGAQGTRISFPAAAFVDYYDSTQIINGVIDFTMQEVNSRKDLVLNGLMTGATGVQQMIVGGMIQNIMASQFGNAVKVNPALPAGSIVVDLPSSAGAGGGLSKYYIAAGNFGWTNGGAVNGNSPYNFSIDKMKMFGMLSSNYSAAKADVAANATITVKVNYEDAGYNPNPGANDQVTIVKLIYKDAPSVVSFGGFNYSNSSASGPVTNGRNATIVVYSGGPIVGTNNSTYFYFGTLSVTLQAGQTYTLDLKKTDQASLDIILNNI